jgi:hypothetical protein
LAGGGASTSASAAWADCTPLLLAKVTYLSQSGQVVPKPVAGGGQIDVYQTLQGDPVTSLVLPAGLDLSTASPQVIHDLGLPPVPSDPVQRQIWTAAFGGPASPGPATVPCETHRYN